jgi:hypothetical protein
MKNLSDLFSPCHAWIDQADHDFAHWSDDSEPFFIVLGAALVCLVWWLLTGRKPVLLRTVTRFHQTSQKFGPEVWHRPGGPPSKDNMDVVDVQAHEVQAVLARVGHTTAGE